MAMIIEMGISVLFDFAFVNKKKTIFGIPLYGIYTLSVKKYYKFTICYKAVYRMENWKS